jgi:hypothetical protein
MRALASKKRLSLQVLSKRFEERVRNPINDRGLTHPAGTIIRNPRLCHKPSAKGTAGSPEALRVFDRVNSTFGRKERGFKFLRTSNPGDGHFRGPSAADIFAEPTRLHVWVPFYEETHASYPIILKPANSTSNSKRTPAPSATFADSRRKVLPRPRMTAKDPLPTYLFYRSHLVSAVRNFGVNRPVRAI